MAAIQEVTIVTASSTRHLSKGFGSLICESFTFRKGVIGYIYFL